MVVIALSDGKDYYYRCEPGLSVCKKTQGSNSGSLCSARAPVPCKAEE